MRKITFILASGFSLIFLASSDDCLDAIDVDQDGFPICDDFPSTDDSDCDCDDDDPLTYPDAEETNDGIDNDCDGSLEWERTYRESWGSSNFRTVLPSSGGGYIATGWSDQANEILKIDNFGNVVWEQPIHPDTDAVGYDILELENGNFVVTGYIRSEPQQAIVSEFNLQGDRVWMMTFEEPAITSVAQSEEDGLIFLGSSRSEDGNAFIVKMDSDRAIEWSQIFQVESNFYQTIHSVSDGGYSVDAGDLTKFDEAGNIEWVQAYAGSIRYSEPLEEGGSILCGKHIHDSWLAKVDETGQLIWERTYLFEGDHRSGDCRAVHKTSDNGYILGGELDVTYRDHGFALKVDASGTEEWCQEYSILDNGLNAYSIRETDDGGFVIGGGAEVDYYYYTGIIIKTDPVGNTVYSSEITYTCEYDDPINCRVAPD